MGGRPRCAQTSESLSSSDPPASASPEQRKVIEESSTLPGAVEGAVEGAALLAIWNLSLITTYQPDIKPFPVAINGRKKVTDSLTEAAVPQTCSKKAAASDAPAADVADTADAADEVWWVPIGEIVKDDVLRSFLTAQATLQRVTIPEHPAVFFSG